MTDSLRLFDRPNSYIGRSVPRPDARRLLSGRGRFVDDKTLPRMLSECGFEDARVGYAPSYLESYPTGPLVAVGSQALRFASWATRRQTMLVVSAKKK